MSLRRARRAVSAVAAMGTALLLAACDAGTPPRNELRFRTEEFVIRVVSETRPVRALEPIAWRVTVHDAESGLPIQGGQGRIYATNRDRKTVANGLEETGELGTYRSNLMYVTAGMWAMAIQFRRDSTKALQTTQDWTQDVLSADEPGDFTTPQSTRLPATPAAPPPQAPATPPASTPRTP